jgi:deoxyguanosine kinase
MENLRFLTIEGNIGAGKTSLAMQLAETFGAQLILEQFAENPFLELFYRQPRQYAFPVEMFFLVERFQQLQSGAQGGGLFSKMTISDYLFDKSKLFARANLSDEEFRLYSRFAEALGKTFISTDLLVYLHAPAELLMRNIRRRGRSFENYISLDYLKRIQQAYFSYFKLQHGFPILILDVSNVDFVNRREDYEHIAGLIRDAPSTGIHKVIL